MPACGTVWYCEKSLANFLDSQRNRLAWARCPALSCDTVTRSLSSASFQKVERAHGHFTLVQRPFKAARGACMLSLGSYHHQHVRLYISLLPAVDLADCHCYNFTVLKID